ncbi:hypothetical protein HY310_00295 [Candidatus Microgenomates bacterium]|nr:hypothetical protein [Candidatus Microgenomates bacterium]
MTEKIVGYSLLAVGVLLIIFSAVNVFNVFTGNSKPIQLFKLSGISVDFTQQMSASLPAEFTKSLNIKQAVSKPTEIVPAELLNDTSNLFAHIMLMGFIAATGQKLASLGVQLVRPIVVKYNEPKVA